MRKALMKPANNAAWITNQLSLTPKGGKTYKDEDGVHLFKPFSLALAVNDLHSWGSVIRRCAVMWLLTYLYYSIPRQSSGCLVPLGNTDM